MSDENVSDSFRKVETNQHDHEANLDVVFGEINENGPDYHAVRRESLTEANVR